MNDFPTEQEMDYQFAQTRLPPELPYAEMMTWGDDEEPLPPPPRPRMTTEEDA